MKLRRYTTVISLLIITCFVSVNDASSQAAEGILDTDKSLKKSIFFGGGRYNIDPEKLKS